MYARLSLRREPFFLPLINGGKATPPPHFVLPPPKSPACAGDLFVPTIFARLINFVVQFENCGHIISESVSLILDNEIW